VDLLAEYLKFLNFERGLSPLTRKHYARDIETLIELSGTTDFNSIKSPDIRRHVASLHSKGLTGKSIARMLC